MSYYRQRVDLQKEQEDDEWCITPEGMYLENEPDYTDQTPEFDEEYFRDQ
jgi:hypothetical protein